MPGIGTKTSATWMKWQKEGSRLLSETIETQLTSDVADQWLSSGNLLIQVAKWLLT